MKITYRPEIDGMRAIAVIAVLIYHLKIPVGEGSVLPGGFLGVDLFFVLSGFLITKILLSELIATGSINFRDFYSRRARRIMPPLLLVMAISIPISWAVLLPTELTRFGESLVAALGFVSNIFWFLTLDGYGSQSSLLQPFLHTWSLAIEEQFYFVFPIVLLGLFRMGGRSAIGVAILSLGILSLVLAQLTNLWNSEFSFFSPVSRAWELLAGSGLAYLSLKRQTHLRANRLARFVPTIALLTLVGYFLTFSLQGSSHPGLMTVPVVLASCALLWFAQSGEPVTELLSTRLFVSVGKLSYSIYLWHFPIFAFGRLSNIDGISAFDRISWLAATFVLSIIGYYLIERPFRFRITARPFVATVSSVVVVIVFFGGVSRYSDVIAGNRLAQLDVIYGTNSYDNEKLRDLSWSILDSLAPDEKIGTWNAHRPSEHEKNADWFIQTDSRKVLILGNSHSKDLFNAVFLNADVFHGIEFSRFGISKGFPQEQFDSLLQSSNFKESNVVAIAPSYNEAILSRIPAIVETLQSFGKEVLLIGNTAEIKSPISLPIFDWYIRTSDNTANLYRMNSVAFGYEDRNVSYTNQKLRQIANDVGVDFLSRRNLICNDEIKTCTLVSANGRKTMYDDGHWTLDGARHFGKVAAREGWFR